MTALAHDGRKQPTLRSLGATIGILVGLTVLVALACSFVGQENLRWTIWRYRMMRMVAAAIVGGGLASAGMALQGLLRNPLAEPYILGISSGAGVGVLVGKVFLGAMGVSTPALALCGALATCALVYGIAQRRGRLHPLVLLLSGVIVNVFNGAVMFSLLLFADKTKILEFIRWGMGEVPEEIFSRSALLALCACFTIGGWAILLVRSAALNTMGLGDEVAQSAGVSVHWLRVEMFVVAGLMTAAAVSLAGPIGFVGLIVPHVCRLIVGPDHRRLVIYSALVGAMFLMVADTLCKAVGPPLGVGKIPVGVVTALAGGPFFIILLRRRFRGASM